MTLQGQGDGYDGHDGHNTLWENQILRQKIFKINKRLWIQFWSL